MAVSVLAGKARQKPRQDRGGTKAETSPTMDAICRTKVAVMGRTRGDAGRKTV